MGNIHDYFPTQHFPIGIHKVCWWGMPGHYFPGVTYRSDDTTVIVDQMTKDHNNGIDFVVVDWYGDSPTYRLANRAAARHLTVAAQVGMQFAIQIDVGAIKAKKTSQSNTAEFLDLLGYVDAFFATNKAYQFVASKPAVYEFGMEELTSDPIVWTDVVKAYPGYQFIHRNVDGFTRHPGAGSYAWIDNGIPYLQDYYKRALTPSASAPCFGSLFSSFDDRKRDPKTGLPLIPAAQVWGKVDSSGKPVIKIIDPANGQTFLDTVAELIKAIAAGVNIAGTIINTRDDYEEGSAIGDGIKVVPPSPAVQTTVKPLFLI